MDGETEFACRVIKQNGQHQQRTLLQMSPVALESEADMIVLPALSSPPLHRKRQNPPPPPPLQPVVTGGRERVARSA